MRRPAKTCPVCESGVRVLDYKDDRTLGRFLTERGKILPSRLSGMCARHQRQLAAAAGVALLAGPENGVFDALTRTWIVLVTVAFAAGARLSRKGFWPLALRACLYAAAGVTVLVAWSRAGPALWTEVQWEATRDASRAMRYVVEVAPGLYPAFEPAVRLLAAWPLWLVVESLVGLALAWRSHAVIARTPFSAAGINH